MGTSRSKIDQITIVTPVYNEAENFPALYAACKKKIKTPYKLVVVYDFDEDTTVPVVKGLQKKDKNLVLHKNTKGRGPLNALLAGFEYVKKGPLLVTMSDLSDDLSRVDKAYQAYKKGSDVVCMSRYMKGGKQIGGPRLKKFLSRLAGTSLYYMRRLPTHDVTNNFKLYDKAVIDTMEIQSTGGFEVAMEITVKAFIQGAHITEIPTTWKDRTSGESNFKLWKWLPSYLRWYVFAFQPKNKAKS